MAASARWNHVWLGTETGILKGVNLQRKQATNFTESGRLRREEEVTVLAWGDETESQILVGCANGEVKRFSTEKGTFTSGRRCPGGEGVFRGLARHDGCLVTCVESGIIRVWPEDTSEHRAEVQVGPKVCRMRQDPERPHLVATGGKENALKVWDLQGSQEPVFRAKNVRNDWLDLRVPIWDQDIQFLPGSQRLVTCTGYHQVRVYDPSSPTRRPVLEASYGEYPLTALTLVPGGTSVVVGNTHGQLAEIDLRQGRLVCCLKGLAGSVRGLQCHPTRPLLASCGLDRVLRVHRLRDPRGLEHKVSGETGCPLSSAPASSRTFLPAPGNLFVKSSEKQRGLVGRARARESEGSPQISPKANVKCPKVTDPSTQMTQKGEQRGLGVKPWAREPEGPGF
uniref:WD repeat-containing protein 74 n=1 Tax=Ornithorhynchus anatinus TaxID=9258 RepID=A0A6I8N6L8_ORNAN